MLPVKVDAVIESEDFLGGHRNGEHSDAVEHSS
jgi:hypothetical protein